MRFEDRGQFDMRAGTYSERKVYCPNATRIGSSKWFAEPGDLVTYSYGEDDQRTFLGRVLGRVDSDGNGPALPPVEGWIAVLELGMCASTAWVRWIAPAWIKEVRTVRSRKFLTWFFDDISGPGNEKVETILKHSHYGSLNERAMDDRPYLENGALIDDPNEAWRERREKEVK